MSTTDQTVIDLTASDDPPTASKPTTPQQSSTHTTSPTSTPVTPEQKKTDKYSDKPKRKKRRTTDTMLTDIPKASFGRLAREIAHSFSPDIRLGSNALARIQYSSESYLCDTFDDVNATAIHSKRTTISGKDMKLVRKIRRI